MQALQKLQAEKGQIDRQLEELKHAATVESRLKHLNEVHLRDKDQPFAIQYTTIHKAAYDGNISGVQHFQQLKGFHAVNIDTFDQTGKACIHIASERGHQHIIEFLLSKGSNINLKTTKDDTTALMYACSENQLECVEGLIRAGAKIFMKNKSGYTAMHYAAQGDHVDVIDLVRRYCAGTYVLTIMFMRSVNRITFICGANFHNSGCRML